MEPEEGEERMVGLGWLGLGLGSNRRASDEAANWAAANCDVDSASDAKWLARGWGVNSALR